MARVSGEIELLGLSPLLDVDYSKLARGKAWGLSEGVDSHMPSVRALNFGLYRRLNPALDTLA
jgi:hypothetical protein